MEPRISLITLGVADLGRSRAFYEKLGFRGSSASQGDIVFFQAGSMALALYPRDALAEDAQVASEGAGFRGISLAHNVRDKAEVAAILAEAEAAGGRILKPAQDVFWPDGVAFGFRIMRGSQLCGTDATHAAGRCWAASVCVWRRACRLCCGETGSRRTCWERGSGRTSCYSSDF